MHRKIFVWSALLLYEKHYIKPYNLFVNHTYFLKFSNLVNRPTIFITSYFTPYMLLRFYSFMLLHFYAFTFLKPNPFIFLQLLALQKGKLAIVLTQMLYAKEHKCLGCKAQALQPFLFLPIDSECYSEFLLYSILSHVSSQEESKLCFECLKTRFVPQNYLLSEDWAIPPKSDLPFMLKFFLFDF